MIHIEDGMVYSSNVSDQEMLGDIECCIATYIYFAKDKGMPENEIEKALIELVAKSFRTCTKAVGTSFSSSVFSTEDGIDSIVEDLHNKIKNKFGY